MPPFIYNNAQVPATSSFIAFATGNYHVERLEVSIQLCLQAQECIDTTVWKMCSILLINLIGYHVANIFNGTEAAFKREEGLKCCQCHCRL